MSQTSSFFKNLFNIKTHKNAVSLPLSTQELYVFYCIFNKYDSKLSFFKFYTLMYILTSTNTFKNKENFILGFIFNIKTLPIIKTTPALVLVKIPRLNTLYIRDITSINKFNNFWKKFKKLKRPSTEENFNDYFLSNWGKKITIYKNLSFVKTTNMFYLVCSKSEELVRNVVLVDKKLLVSPKFSSTSINKFLNVQQLDNFEFQFLRKNKVYNKGRYSRCRQNYRTGVYMCMYLSVCSIFGLYYWFYKFSFNFTYLWWFFIVFVASFFFPKIVKYRLYEPTTLFNKFIDFFKWFAALVRSLFF